LISPASETEPDHRDEEGRMFLRTYSKRMPLLPFNTIQAPSQ